MYFDVHDSWHPDGADPLQSFSLGRSLFHLNQPPALTYLPRLMVHCHHIVSGVLCCSVLSCSVGCRHVLTPCGTASSQFLVASSSVFHITLHPARAEVSHLEEAGVRVRLARCGSVSCGHILCFGSILERLFSGFLLTIFPYLCCLYIRYVLLCALEGYDLFSLRQPS